MAQDAWPVEPQSLGEADQGRDGTAGRLLARASPTQPGSMTPLDHGRPPAALLCGNNNLAVTTVRPLSSPGSSPGIPGRFMVKVGRRLTTRWPDLRRTSRRIARARHLSLHNRVLPSLHRHLAYAFSNRCRTMYRSATAGGSRSGPCHKPQRHRVDAVAQASWIGPVLEHMTEMCIAALARHGGAHHQAPAGGFCNIGT